MLKTAHFLLSMMVIIVFFVILGMPLVGYFQSDKNTISPLNENRYLAEFPNFSEIPPETWAKKLAGYLADNNIYRNYLMESYFYLHEWFLYSPVRYAFRGTNDQMFMLDMVKKHATRPFLLEEEKSILAASYGYFAYFSEKGIYCLLTIPPDKETGLSVDLPQWVSSGPCHAILKKIQEFTKEKKIPYVDLTGSEDYPDAVKKYNRYSDLYHWNGYGLHISYQKCAEFLRARFGETFRPASSSTDYAVYGVDTTAIMGLKEKALKTKILDANRFVAKDLILEGVVSAAKDFRSPSIITNTQIPEGKKMLFVGDSYTQDASPPGLQKEAGGWTPAYPFVYNVKEFMRIWTSDATVANMEKILEFSQPDIAVLALCERGGLGTRNRDMILLGEERLGNMKISLFSAFQNIAKSHDNNDRNFAVTLCDDAIEVKFLRDAPTIKLHSVTTDKDGYAVVGGRIRSNSAGRLRLHYVTSSGGGNFVTKI